MKKSIVKVVSPIIIAAVLLFALYVNTARTFQKRNMISRSEYYVFMLSEQLTAEAAGDADHAVSQNDIIDSISLHTEPKWYQYLPEHLVFEAKLRNEDQPRCYLYVPKAEDRQDGKLFVEVDPDEIPENLGLSDGFVRAVIPAAIALLIIMLLIVRPIVKALANKDGRE